MSISLWDLHHLGGLAITGSFYDEVVPCYKEMAGCDEKGRFIPKSCEYLFAAFYRLYNEKEGKPHVSVNDWIKFWFRGDSKYMKPPPRRLKRSCRPKQTYNPDGSFGKAHAWSLKEKGGFADLEVQEGLCEETYFAALLSCWLCIFVLLSEDLNTIRLGTFKVASLMAIGRPFSLAIPVLTSLYRGLNSLAHSSVVSSSKVCLPMHYVYGWLGHYFDTHHGVKLEVIGPKLVRFSGAGRARYYDEYEARRLIQGNRMLWGANLLVKNTNETFEDNGNLSHTSLEHFISIRSSYLSM